jgi:hypothetical protein
MFSSFGVSAILSSIFVRFLQYKLGFSGMLAICLGFTNISLLLTFVYDSKGKFNYSNIHRQKLEMIRIEPYGRSADPQASGFLND